MEKQWERDMEEVARFEEVGRAARRALEEPTEMWHNQEVRWILYKFDRKKLKSAKRAMEVPPWEGEEIQERRGREKRE